MDTNTTTQLSQNDHDLLVESRVDIRDIKKSIIDLKDSMSAQFSLLVARVDGNEARIRKLETIVEQTQPFERLKEFELLKKQFTEQQIANKYDRRNWSIVGGLVSGITVTVISGLILHFIGKI